jgi:hypothetical protein
MARLVAMGDEDLARIDACLDVATLDAWLTNAAQATTAREVFGD